MRERQEKKGEDETIDPIISRFFGGINLGSVVLGKQEAILKHENRGHFWVIVLVMLLDSL